MLPARFVFYGGLMNRRVQYTRNGGPEVLDLIEEDAPTAQAGEVRVRVHSVGLNPLDAKLFRGLPTANPIERTLPSGNGTDFAGVIDQVGPGVEGVELGDRVFGSRLFHAQADRLVIDPSRLNDLRDDLTFDQGASLTTAGGTAWASVRAIDPTDSDIVLVSAAAGGVGILASQLTLRTGARVIGTASKENHDFLRSLGVEPVEYGDGLVQRVLELAPEGITAALDNHGRASVDAAIALGAPVSRINTIADYAAKADYGVSMVGGAAATREDLAEMARLVAKGDVQLPIEAVYPLERVREAYEHLLAGHLRGKIVLALV